MDSQKNDMKPSYLNLCTEFYDLSKPEAGPKEVAFYEKLLKTAKGPILEAMCGSGRLLIPLLKKGFALEGVDNSQHMLQSCQKRCSTQGLSIQLHNQALQKLALPRKYDIIFIAIGSFQLVHDDKEARYVLAQLHSALQPGGRLVIETFIPWDAIKDNIHGSTLAEQSNEVVFEKAVNAADGSQIIHKSAVTIYFNQQLEKTRSSYEKWIDKRMSHSEEEEYIVRWYHRFELQLLLEKTGFSTVTILDDSFEQNEQAVIYIASKSERV
jgi:cyclopropane fatty-acyl-phospholipid synthase-like methyltransferase